MGRGAPGGLPAEAELQAFAHAAAHLLIERTPRLAGARTVARRPGVGIQPLDHRDYAPGDEVRHIDWRLTARARRPIVRRFEAESVTDWTLVLDASSSMAVLDGAKWRAAVQATAALAYALLQLGHRVGLLVFGAGVIAECPRGRGAHHYAAIARRLSALQPAPAGARSSLGVCAPHLQGTASVFTVSDFLADDEMRRDLSALRQRCSTLHALQLSHAGETRLPAGAELDLVDIETGARLQVQGDARAAAGASAERAAMTTRLRGFCSRSGIAFSDWDVALPWQRALLSHLVRARSRC